ncbi:MAG: hypothetical protein ACR2N1_11835 [Rubripirellula sp.]
MSLFFREDVGKSSRRENAVSRGLPRRLTEDLGQFFTETES